METPGTVTGRKTSPPTPRTRPERIPGSARSVRRSTRGTITLTIASRRRGVLKTLLPRLASEGDLTILGDPVVDPAGLLARLQQRLPRLLLLDERLLGRLDRESASAIHSRFPRLRVLLLCDRECPASVEEVVRNRFHGLLTASDRPETWAKAIRTVHQGELWVPRALLAKAIFEPVHAAGRDPDTRLDRAPSDAVGPLTKREVQVVDYLRVGLTNKEIARELGIMEDTVKKHLYNLFGKLGVHRRAQIILLQSGVA